MLRIRLMLALIVTLLAPLSMAIAAPDDKFHKPGVCRPINTPITRMALDSLYERDEFRIYYSLTGSHAIPDRTDSNSNGIPDRVEDVATQLVVARDIYTKVLGLRHPLQQPRYASATAINVLVLNRSVGGASYDEVLRDLKTRRCVLSLDVSNRNTNRNVSPAHELFHLYQWGYSMFKPRWFMEGTARWAEHSLAAAPAREKALPSDEATLNRDFLKQLYPAGLVWNRLAALLDPVGRLNLPPELLKASYLDGKSVVRDDEMHGGAFMKALMEEMARYSEEVARKEGWPAYTWRESDQRKPEYDKGLLRAVLVVAKRQAQELRMKNAELELFLNTVEAHINKTESSETQATESSPVSNN
jgi:hypothetical protein